MGSAPTQGFGTAFGSTGTTSTVFGQGPQLRGSVTEGATSPYAAPFGGSTPFGQSPGRSLFGASSNASPTLGQQITPAEISSTVTIGQTSVFGSKAGPPSVGGFASASNMSSGSPFAKGSPAFGQVSFGQSQLRTLGQGFGATPPTNSFVPTTQVAQGGGTLFGKPTQPIFGQPSTLGKSSNPFLKPSDENEMAMSDDQPAQGPSSGSSLFGGQFQSQAFKTFR